jgi:hypothetical protein
MLRKSLMMAFAAAVLITATTAANVTPAHAGCYEYWYKWVCN